MGPGTPDQASRSSAPGGMSPLFSLATRPPAAPLEKGAALLALLRGASTDEEYAAIIFEVARAYAPYIGVDYDAVAPELARSKNAWDAEYGQVEVSDLTIGMSRADAWKCLFDVQRTTLLGRGIGEIIAYQHREEGGERYAALDLGTGTGILAMFAAAHAAERFGHVKVVAVEYNPDTCEATRRFLEDHGLDDWITVVPGDATTIRLEDHVDPADLPFRLVITETTSTGGMDEPWEDIKARARRYCDGQTRFVPARAEHSAYVGNGDWSQVDSAETALAVARLPGFEAASERTPFAVVDSENGMTVRSIEGQASGGADGSNFSVCAQLVVG